MLDPNSYLATSYWINQAFQAFISAYMRACILASICLFGVGCATDSLQGPDKLQAVPHLRTRPLNQRIHPQRFVTPCKRCSASWKLHNVVAELGVAAGRRALVPRLLSRCVMTTPSTSSRFRCCLEADIPRAQVLVLLTPFRGHTSPKH